MSLLLVNGTLSHVVLARCRCTPLPGRYNTVLRLMEVAVDVMPELRACSECLASGVRRSPLRGCVKSPVDMSASKVGGTRVAQNLGQLLSLALALFVLCPCLVSLSLSISVELSLSLSLSLSVHLSVSRAPCLGVRQNPSASLSVSTFLSTCPQVRSPAVFLSVSLCLSVSPPTRTAEL